MEEKVNNKVPGFVLSTFLFLLFYKLIRTVLNELPVIYYNTYDAAIAEDEPIHMTFCSAFLYVILLVLSFWSIIRFLKGKPDSVSCIRWSLSINIIVVVYEFLKALPNAIYVSWYLCQGSVLPLVLYVLILWYLAKSKEVKHIFPKPERRYKPGGLIWTSYFVVCILAFVYICYYSIERDKKSHKLPLTTINVQNGYYTDGSILFKSDDKWIEKSTAIENMDSEEDSITMYQLDCDSLDCLLWGGISEKSRHSDFVGLLLQLRPEKDAFISSETNSMDTLINGDQYYLEQYLYKTDSVDIVWTFAVRYDKETNKYCAMSKYNKQHDHTQEDAIDLIGFLKIIEFDLTKYLRAQ